ncbi:MAG: 16S rRNA (cytosine(1402)-N(4))-methyltransferase RsmH [Bacteroidales bacterium]|jgi:16S rRNA (cytosine1402-N4)-methyltransferase|nr:16S rRNA (cytosine(1402)-N(4))-methyltransferase RsmH [Bacteroidales bacterium]
MLQQYHIPVLPNESIYGLNIRQGDDVVDATFGGGGHSRLILKLLGEDGRLFAFDQDEDTAANVIDDKRFFFIRHNFRYLKNFIRFYDVENVDSIFADLGVSSHDFDVPERGFSFRFDGPLDMRMNRSAEKSAATVVNEYTEERLFFIFKMYGEITNGMQLVSKIIKSRAISAITTTAQLREIASTCMPKSIENKYLAQVFQALRIEVNDEMDALKEFLQSAFDVLKQKGRLVVITYHSIEDRLCKNFMKSGNFEGKIEKDFFGNMKIPFNVINRKVITPGEEELRNNTRSRSAKLRIAEKN